MARSAVVIGSGPNGLAAAVTLARAGLRVDVHEEAETVGGGLRSAELTLPGFVHDVCSAIHPLARTSPFFRELDLPLEWVTPPAAAAHPFDDGTAITLESDVAATAAQLGRDAAAYRRLFELLAAGWPAIEPVVVGPYPPSPSRLAGAVRALGPLRFPGAAAAALADASSFARSAFRDERTRGFFAGHAAHSILPLDRRPSAGFGLTLVAVGHALGWPLACGGSQRIADALVGELTRLGGAVHTRSRVDDLPRADVVLADVTPRELLRIARGRLSGRYAAALRAYRHGPGAFKLDWALSGPIPWTAEECSRAATVHLGASLDEIQASERAPWDGTERERPFVIVAQQSLFDETRAPAGSHTAWAYCHVANGSPTDMTEAIEAQVERFAPGFRELVLARSAIAPAEIEAHNRSMPGGDINGGAMDLGQLFTRPVARRVPYRTPLRGVYLCSAATPPGGGAHGMCGYAAALTAIRDAGL